jgi:hypothetical protein
MFDCNMELLLKLCEKFDFLAVVRSINILYENMSVMSLGVGTEWGQGMDVASVRR